MLVRITLDRTPIHFSMKVLGFIGDFFQKSPMWVWAKPTTFPSENLGWWYLNSCGSYSAVCRRNIPIQGDVAPMAWIESKTFIS